MIVLYLLIVNLAAFAAMGFDKRRAERGDRRIPERDLLSLALIGGSLGAIAAQRTFRHKTRKEPFRTWLNGILVAQIGLVGIYLFMAPD